MRPTILASILALMLLLAPTALATSEAGAKGKQASEAAKADRPKNDDDTPAARADQRRSERDNATANHTAAIDRLLDQVRALRASWQENASAAREACHAAMYDAENGTKETRAKWAHCIRDAYKAWRDANRGEMRELKEEMRQNAREMREWRAAKGDA